MAGTAWRWKAPPGWPEPPPGWSPPPGWRPPPGWPEPPADWQFWEPPPPPLPPPAGAVQGSPSVMAVELTPPARRALVLETWFLMLAFLLPTGMSAVIVFAQHVQGVSNITRFPTIVSGHPVTNLVLGILSYVTIGAVVPLALFLLSRTGQPPSVVGLGWPSLVVDVWPGLGLAVLSFLTEWAVLIPFAPLLEHGSKLVNPVPTGHVPGYYLIWAIAISAVTAITEETIVNGYLLTRLEQLGWSPRRALALSLVLRTSYHVYYGLGFLLTVPFGYYVTRSFQKHRRLNRSIAAHFIYDAVLSTIAILA